MLIGTFCALLELMKIGVVRARQDTRGDDIQVLLREDIGGDLEEIVRTSGFDDPHHGDLGPGPSTSEPGAEEPGTDAGSGTT